MNTLPSDMKALTTLKEVFTRGSHFAGKSEDLMEQALFEQSILSLPPTPQCINGRQQEVLFDVARAISTQASLSRDERMMKYLQGLDPVDPALQDCLKKIAGLSPKEKHVALERIFEERSRRLYHVSAEEISAGVGGLDSQGKIETLRFAANMVSLSIAPDCAHCSNRDCESRQKPVKDQNKDDRSWVTQIREYFAV